MPAARTLAPVPPEVWGVWLRKEADLGEPVVLSPQAARDLADLVDVPRSVYPADVHFAISNPRDIACLRGIHPIARAAADAQGFDASHYPTTGAPERVTCTSCRNSDVFKRFIAAAFDAPPA